MFRFCTGVKINFFMTPVNTLCNQIAMISYIYSLKPPDSISKFYYFSKN